LQYWGFSVINLTINEIAKLAQVSKGTVSKVLNNYPGINIKTRERILKIVKEVGYQPNSSAQALAFRRTGNIGLIIPHSPEHALNSAYWSSFVTAVTDRVTRLGFNLVLHLPQREGNLGALFESIIRKRQIDGLIIGAELLDKVYLATLLVTEMPFVMLGQNPEFRHFAVDIDNKYAGHQITSYLHDRGYRRIAFISGPEEYYYNLERQAGYRLALQEKTCSYECSTFLPYQEFQTMADRLQSILTKNRPDAIICAAGGDFMFDCLEILRRNDFAIPRNGFATFDDYRYLDHTLPRITAVRQPINEMGDAAVTTLINLLQSKTPESQSTIFRTTIVARQSCGEESLL